VLCVVCGGVVGWLVYLEEGLTLCALVDQSFRVCSVLAVGRVQLELLGLVMN